MTTLEGLSSTGLRATVTRFRDAVRANQQRLNRLNVYPVPDGDTGTNMARTLDAVVAEMETAGSEMGPTCQAISHGSLMGARGNSGVILSQILRGFADVVRHVEEVSPATVAEAFTSAAKAAYSAVLRPIEGTILTVVREVAEATAEAAKAEGATLVSVLEVARTAGRASLDRTPDLLPVLRDAGVVDAGAAGFLLLIDAALNVVDGRPLPDVDAPTDELTPMPSPAVGDGTGGVADLRYEVMYLLDLADAAIGGFKEAWGRIGDSIVVVGGEGLWNCHVHTNDIGAALEAALDAGGRPRAIRVTDLFEEVEANHAEREAAMAAPPAQHRQVAVVAVSAGSGLAELYRALGVSELVTGGQTMNPSTAELLAAVERAPAQSVVVLPNNKNIVPVAEQLHSLTSKSVHVVPTHAAPQALAALLAYDPEGDGDAVADGMAEAASAVRCGEVTQAVRDSSSDAGAIAAGDWIGIARGDGIVSVTHDVVSATTGLLAVLVDGSVGLVTLIEGEGSSGSVTEAIEAWLAEHRAGVEVEIHQGGQPLYPYVIGVE